jgi:hypothetical protein
LAGPIRRFRALLNRPGGRPQAFFGLIGRAPGSMLSVAFVAGASATGGEAGYALGGLAAGAYALGSAIVGPMVGRAADRLGQREVGRPLALASAGAVVLAALSLLVLGPTPLLVVLAAAAGASQPNVGAFARVRWAALLDRGDEAATAQALESVIDETTFLVGPTVVALLAGIAFAGFPMIIAAGLLLIGAFGATSALVLPAPARHPPEPGARRRPEFPPGIGLLVAVFALGVALGAVQVLQLAYCQALGAESGAALVFFLNSGTSLVGAVLVGGTVFRTPARRRFTIALIVYAVGVVPSALVGGYVPFVLASILSGAAIAPTFIQANGVVAEEAPPRIRTAAFAVLGSATVFGIAIGAALAGQAVARVGGDEARVMLLPLAAACAVAAVFADVSHRASVTSPLEPANDDQRAEPAEIAAALAHDGAVVPPVVPIAFPPSAPHGAEEPPQA